MYTCPKARINDFIISYVLKIVESKRFSQLFSNSLTASYQLHSRDCKFLIFLELAELIGVRAEQLCPLNVVPKQFFVNMVSLSTEYQPDVNFLILRMSSVISSAHGQQDHILTSCLLENDIKLSPLSIASFISIALG